MLQVVREAYPDLTAQDKGSKYFDPKATPEDPRWSMVDFKLVRASGNLAAGRLERLWLVWMLTQGSTIVMQPALVLASACHSSCHV